MAKKRTVVKTKAADGSKSKVVTRKMKDGTTKVKSKTKSGGVVTKRKVRVGPKSTSSKTVYMGDPTTPSNYAGSLKVRTREKAKKLRLPSSSITAKKKTTSQSVKGKETVKNRNAKKGEVRKTKSKIDGTRTSIMRTATSSKNRQDRADITEKQKTRVTPAAKKTVKTKIKKRGRK
tara:strand:+ start:25 stop:552 length:528 start_codon:yes stop_codon:yes gene_type:complete